MATLKLSVPDLNMNYLFEDNVPMWKKDLIEKGNEVEGKEQLLGTIKILVKEILKALFLPILPLLMFLMILLYQVH